MADLESVLAENGALKRRLVELENDWLQESVEYFNRYVDPQEALRGPEGLLWPQVGGLSEAEATSSAFADEQQLADARSVGRELERTNEFAINGHENRISYIVGTGHTYTVVAKKGEQATTQQLRNVQEVLDEFLRENRWQQCQQEIVRRRDRDGEAFLRLFVAADAITRIRFVEPSQVSRPSDWTHDASHSFGIQTEPDDVETVLAYWIDGAPVEAADVQHRKLGVDRNVKRGIPLFYPVRKNLLRAEKLLSNMAAVADIQTAIAMIRRHDRTTKSAAEAFRNDASMALANQASGFDPVFLRHYAPGTILDAPKTVQYDFPAAGLDASRYVQVLQAILRSVAARLVFPEFMLTSDAANANYASTLVAESPAIKTFERWQADMRTDDLALMWQVLQTAVRLGRLERNDLCCVEIQVGIPRVSTRDLKTEAEVNEIYLGMGVKSKQTIASEIGLDFDQEQENLRAASPLV